MRVKALINSVWRTVPEEWLLIGGPDFAYPSGLYETLRTVDFIPAFLNAHLERLYRGAASIRLEIPYTKGEIIKQVLEVIHRFPEPHQRLRIIAVPGKVVIFTSALNLDPTIYRGVNVISLPLSRRDPEIKTTETEASLHAWLKARERGCFETLLVSRDGTVFEGSRSNVFWVEGESLVTKKTGVLPGTVRNLILERAPCRISFSNLNIHHLERVTEIFLTNSGSGLVPVKKVDDHPVREPVPGPVTCTLLSRYENWLQGDIRDFKRRYDLSSTRR